MNRRGFTLIELLVVVGLISLLAAIVLSSISDSRAKGRDTKRISDMRSLITLIELYRANEGHLPNNTDNDNATGGWDIGNTARFAVEPADTFIEPLRTSGLLNQQIIETSGKFLDEVSYRYFKYDISVSGAVGCSGKVVAVLMMRLERSQTNYRTYEDIGCYTGENYSSDDWLVHTFTD